MEGMGWMEKRTAGLSEHLLIRGTGTSCATTSSQTSKFKEEWGLKRSRSVLKEKSIVNQSIGLLFEVNTCSFLQKEAINLTQHRRIYAQSRQTDR